MTFSCSDIIFLLVTRETKLGSRNFLSCRLPGTPPENVQRYVQIDKEEPARSWYAYVSDIYHHFELHSLMCQLNFEYVAVFSVDFKLLLKKTVLLVVRHCQSWNYICTVCHNLHHRVSFAHLTSYSIKLPCCQPHGLHRQCRSVNLTPAPQNKMSRQWNMHREQGTALC